MRDFQWYRKLRGGMWVRLFLDWYRVDRTKFETAAYLKSKGYMIEDHRRTFPNLKAKMKNENFAFLKRVTVGVLLGAFLCTALHIYRPTTQADVDLAKVEAQAKQEAIAAQNAAKERAALLVTPSDVQERRVRCVVDLTNALSREYIKNNGERFTALTLDICK